MNDVVIRDLTASDTPFPRQLLDEAAFWRRYRPEHRETLLSPARRVPTRFILRRYLGLYHRDWGRAGDTGLIAHLDSRPVGACWYRLYTGEGYVDYEPDDVHGRILLDLARAEAE